MLGDGRNSGGQRVLIAPIDDLIQGAAIGLQEPFRASAGSIAPVCLQSCAGWMLSTSIEVSGAPAALFAIRQEELRLCRPATE